MAWTRLTLGLTTTLFLAATGSALAQSPAKQADQLNEQGKALLNAKPMRAAEATAKFRAAIVLSPEGRFYLNLCMALYQEGKLGEAHTACQAVEGKGATAAQVKQAGVIVDKFIVPKMREAGIDPDAPNGNQTDPGTGNQTDPGTGNQTDPGTGNQTDPGTGNQTDPGTGNTGNTGNQTDPGTGNTAAGNFTVAPPPSLLTQTTTAPTHEYTWTIGAQLFGMSTTIGEEGDWSKGGAGIRIVGDYAINKPKLIGAQGYISFMNVQDTEDSPHMSDSLSVVDLGVGIYKQFCRGRLCLKPLGGVQIAIMQPSELGEDQGFSSFGVRGELGFEYALGARYENVLTLGLGVNAYFPAADNDVALPEEFGLDQTSTNAYVGIGFTRRFATPLGSQPLFTLQ